MSLVTDPLQIYTFLFNIYTFMWWQTFWCKTYLIYMHKLMQVIFIRKMLQIQGNTQLDATKSLWCLWKWITRCGQYLHIITWPFDLWPPTIFITKYQNQNKYLETGWKYGILPWHQWPLARHWSTLATLYPGDTNG